MHVIDMQSSFGKRVDEDPRFTAGALAADLARHQVAFALAHSQKGVEYDPRAGNRESLAAAQAHRALIPAGTVDLRDTPGWEQELDRCRLAGIRVIRLFPERQGWSVRSSSFRKLVAALRGSGLCLAASASGWETSCELAVQTRGAGVALLLTDTAYPVMAEVLAVMEEFDHVLVETSLMATVGAVTVAAETVGAGRLLYGSGAPGQPMQKALNAVLEAELADEDKEAILGGNAARLLGLRAESLAGAPRLPTLDPVRFEEDIVDVHSHLGYWRYPIRDEDHDPSAMLRRMTQYGVTHSVLSSYESMRYDLAAGNRAVAAALAGQPRLRGYVEVNPYQLELSHRELDAYYAQPGFAGCEVELTHIPCPTDSPRVRALMADIARRGRPVLFMPASPADAAAERRLARDNPALTLIHAHGFDAEWARVVADTPSILVEFCASRASHHTVRDVLDILGPQRVLFGSDQTLLSLGSAVGLYWDAALTPAERTPVLSGNARRIFGLRP